MLGQIFGAETMRQKISQRKALLFTAGIGDDDHRIRGGKFADPLAAPTAWRTQDITRIRSPCHRDTFNPATARIEHHGNRRCFGADTIRIGSIFNIRPAMDTSLFIKQPDATRPS